MNLIFFGSFQHYSALILESLIKNSDLLNIVGVVTTPGDNPVSTLAQKHNLPVFTPEKLTTDNLSSMIYDLKSDEKNTFFVTAGYGKLLPPSWLSYPKKGCLNLHFSLLPKYRGANPAEWAILCGETETGITLMHMNEGLDTGDILAQAKIPITERDTRESLYEKLYQLGAKVLPDWLQQIDDFKPQPQISSPDLIEAKRFTRDHGFIDWRIIQAAIGGTPPDMSLLTGHLKKAYTSIYDLRSKIYNLQFIDRATRALYGFPTLWTTIPTKKGPKRMKILTTRFTSHDSRFIIESVQIEGYNPAKFNQIKNQIIYG